MCNVNKFMFNFYTTLYNGSMEFDIMTEMVLVNICVAIASISFLGAMTIILMRSQN